MVRFGKQREVIINEGVVTQDPKEDILDRRNSFIAGDNSNPRDYSHIKVEDISKEVMNEAANIVYDDFLKLKKEWTSRECSTPDQVRRNSNRRERRALAIAEFIEMYRDDSWGQEKWDNIKTSASENSNNSEKRLNRVIADAICDALAKRIEIHNDHCISSKVLSNAISIIDASQANAKEIFDEQMTEYKRSINWIKVQMLAKSKNTLDGSNQAKKDIGVIPSNYADGKVKKENTNEIANKALSDNKGNCNKAIDDLEQKQKGYLQEYKVLCEETQTAINKIQEIEGTLGPIDQKEKLKKIQKDINGDPACKQAMEAIEQAAKIQPPSSGSRSFHLSDLHSLNSLNSLSDTPLLPKVGPKKLSSFRIGKKPEDLEFGSIPLTPLDGLPEGSNKHQTKGSTTLSLHELTGFLNVQDAKKTMKEYSGSIGDMMKTFGDNFTQLLKERDEPPNTPKVQDMVADRALPQQYYLNSLPARDNTLDPRVQFKMYMTQEHLDAMADLVVDTAIAYVLSHPRTRSDTRITNDLVKKWRFTTRLTMSSRSNHAFKLFECAAWIRQKKDKTIPGLHKWRVDSRSHWANLTRREYIAASLGEEAAAFRINRVDQKGYEKPPIINRIYLSERANQSTRLETVRSTSEKITAVDQKQESAMRKHKEVEKFASSVLNTLGTPSQENHEVYTLYTNIMMSAVKAQQEIQSQSEISKLLINIEVGLRGRTKDMGLNEMLANANVIGFKFHNLISVGTLIFNGFGYQHLVELIDLNKAKVKRD